MPPTMAMSTSSTRTSKRRRPRQTEKARIQTGTEALMIVYEVTERYKKA